MRVIVSCGILLWVCREYCAAFVALLSEITGYISLIERERKKKQIKGLKGLHDTWGLQKKKDDACVRHLKMKFHDDNTQAQKPLSRCSRFFAQESSRILLCFLNFLLCQTLILNNVTLYICIYTLNFSIILYIFWILRYIYFFNVNQYVKKIKIYILK